MSSNPYFVQWGPHQVPTSTDFGKELLRHERRPDYNPAANPFPMMLYKARDNEGKIECMDVHPKAFRFATQEAFRMACESVDAFNLSCQLTVNDEAEYKRALADGWRENPKEAYDAAMALHDDIAQAVAHRNYEDRNMSERAKGEIAAAEAETPRLVPEIKESRTVKIDGRTKEARALKSGAA